MNFDFCVFKVLQCMVRAKQNLKLSHGGQIVVLLNEYAFLVQDYNASLKLRLKLSIVLSDAKRKKFKFIKINIVSFL